MKAKKAKGNEDLEHWLVSHLSHKIHFMIHELQIDGKAVGLFDIPAATDTSISFLHEPYIHIGSFTKPLKHYPDQSRNYGKTKRMIGVLRFAMMQRLKTLILKSSLLPDKSLLIKTNVWLKKCKNGMTPPF